MTVKQAAERLGVSPSLVYAWVAEGRLAHSRYGREGRRGKIVIDDQAVEQLAAECRGQRREAGGPLVLNHISLN